tara:strand:- start:123 stop:332 length:210 start_codon:yes stop_codon:yes gene_type:complete
MDFLLLQTGDYLLLQTGDKLILAGGTTVGGGGNGGRLSRKKDRRFSDVEDENEVMHIIREAMAYLDRNN